MRYGICASSDNLETVKAAGYDYLELPVRTVLPEESREAFQPVLEDLRARDFAFDAWNCFLPGDLKLVGPEVDWERLTNYVRTAFCRISKLGGKVVVLGSGRARRVPEGFDSRLAQKQFVRFLRLAAPLAETYGLGIALEPLRTKESNFLNTVSEALELVRDLKLTRVRVLADYYHMSAVGEVLDVLGEASYDLVHVHVAVPFSRAAVGTEEHDFLPLMRALKSVDYRGRISIEAHWKDLAVEAPRALEVLKQAERDA